MASAPTDIGFRDSRLGWTLRDRWEAYRLPAWSRRAAAVAGLVAFGAVWGVAVAVLELPALLLCLSLIACVLTLRDFRAGVALMMMMLPIAQSQEFPRSMFGITGANPLNLLLATTFLSYVMRRSGEKKTAPVFPWQLGLLYLLPFTVAAFIGMEHVGEIPAAFRDMNLIFFDNWVGYLRDLWARPLIFVFYSLLIAAAVARTDRAERFLTPMIVSVFAMAALAVVFIAISKVSLAQMAGTYARDILSPLGMHANDLGRLYATAYALLLFIWDRAHNWTLKTVALCAMGAVVIALLLTFSRGAFFGFIVVNVIYLFARRRLKTLFLAGTVGALGLALMPGAVWYRITMGLATGDLNQITAGRTGDIWTPLVPEFANHPFLGNGLGSVMYSRAMIEGRLWQVAHPHNAFLEAYMNMGAIGSVMVLAFWIWAWRTFRREAREEALTPELRGLFEGAAAGLAAYLVAGMAGGSLQPDATHAFLWLAFGMLLGVRAKRAAAAIAARKGKK